MIIIEFSVETAVTACDRLASFKNHPTISADEKRQNGYHPMIST